MFSPRNHLLRVREQQNYGKIAPKSYSSMLLLQPAAKEELESFDSDAGSLVADSVSLLLKGMER